MADDYPVRVLRVIDGDSVKVRLGDGAEYSVRMYGIDAPEMDQRAGRDSQEYLRRLVQSRREWRLHVVDIDRYQRLVGVLYPEGRSIRESANHAMVESGYAYWFREYGGAELGFDDSERYAQRERAGVWAMQDAVRPWDHRRAKRAGQQSRRSAGPSWIDLLGDVFKLIEGIAKAMAKLSAAGSGSTGRRRRRRRRRMW